MADTDPDLIILDLMMPEIDGWDTLEQLKAGDETKDIPVIISSALSDPEDFEKAIVMGAIDYVPKPWSADDLIARIRSATSSLRKSA